jgi:hypothetical protein
MDTYAADFEVGRGWAAVSGQGARCFLLTQSPNVGDTVRI